LKYTFAHALIPSTLREGMSGPRLRLMHRRAGAAIERLHPEDLEALAYHATQAGDDERARGYFRRAGDRALAVFANQEAERHYRAALDLFPPEGESSAQEKAPLCAGLGEALFRQARYAEAVTLWERAAGLHRRGADFDHAAACVARQVRALWYVGEKAKALQVSRAALDELSRGPETAGLAALLHETGRAYFFSAQRESDPPPEAREYCQQALKLAERFGLIEIQAESLTTLGLIAGQSTAEGLALLQKAIDLTEPVGLYSAAARAYLNMSGGVIDHAGDLSRARHLMRHAADLYRRMGQTFVALEMLLSGEEASLLFGDFETAERTLRIVRQEARTLPDAHSINLMADAVEVDLLTFRGEWQAALELVQQVLAQAEQLGGKSKYIKLHHLQLSEVITRLEMQDWQGVIDRLQPLLADTEFRIGRDEVGPLCLLAMAWARLGNIEAGQQALAEARRIAGEPPKLTAPMQLHWAAAEIHAARGEWDEAIAAFEAGVAEAMKFQAPWFEARLREGCAELYRSRRQPGDTDHADKHLRAALARFEQLKATRYADRVRAQLETLNLQPATP
jgi:tetratricopeptide (TPR) repeat protein